MGFVGEEVIMQTQHIGLGYYEERFNINYCINGGSFRVETARWKMGFGIVRRCY